MRRTILVVIAVAALTATGWAARPAPAARQAAAPASGGDALAAQLA